MEEIDKLQKISKNAIIEEQKMEEKTQEHSESIIEEECISVKQDLDINDEIDDFIRNQDNSENDIFDIHEINTNNLLDLGQLQGKKSMQK